MFFASPQPLPTLPPTITHTVSRPLCSSLKTRIQPAIGMMIQDDATIAKSPGDFEQYLRRATEGSDAGRDLAIMRLESLVSPLADNTIRIRKLLDNPAVFPTVPRNADEKQLLQIKNAMLKSVATQEAALDIINGFVTTMQLGEVQQDNDAKALSSPTPMPNHPENYDDLAVQAGLPPNPYQINYSNINTLSLASNPITRLKDGILFTQGQSKKDEQPLANAVIEAARMCGAYVASPSPSPKP